MRAIACSRRALSQTSSLNAAFVRSPRCGESESTKASGGVSRSKCTPTECGINSRARPPCFSNVARVLSFSGGVTAKRAAAGAKATISADCGLLVITTGARVHRPAASSLNSARASRGAAAPPR